MIAEAIVCLALNAYHEARDQDIRGMIAVSQVVMNRVESRRFPDKVCDVVYQGHHRKSWADPNKRIPIKNKCQFSWYCDGKPDEIDDQQSWKQAQAVAYMLLSRNVMRGISEGSTHYHATYVSPKWAPTLYPIGRIGKHRFYKWL